MPKSLTTLAINAALRESKNTGKTTWLTDGSIPRGHGGLQLRADKGMGRWYWRYSVGTKKVRIALGTYAAEKTQACLTLAEARQVILEKAALYQDPNTRDVREHLKREQ
ncbi:MAG: Arm DNA-binding domain-containing protein, partial [Burkholderiaceae bacterium]|nr:Arm DNA-binding domain-containing protein [Burkholderiaceae bacterium]